MPTQHPNSKQRQTTKRCAPPPALGSAMAARCIRAYLCDHGHAKSPVLTKLGAWDVWGGAPGVCFRQYLALSRDVFCSQSTLLCEAQLWTALRRRGLQGRSDALFLPQPRVAALAFLAGHGHGGRGWRWGWRLGWLSGLRMRGNSARARITVKTLESLIFGEKHAKDLIHLNSEPLTLNTRVRGWGDRTVVRRQLLSGPGPACPPPPPRLRQRREPCARARDQRPLSRVNCVPNTFQPGRDPSTG